MCQQLSKMYAKYEKKLAEAKKKSVFAARLPPPR